MNSYKYLIIDGQYYLRRQWSVLKDGEGFNEIQLLDSFLWVILKIIKNFPSDKVILCWDKRPYKKEQIINEYKSNRYRAAEEVDRVKSEIEATTDEEERKKLSEELKIHENEYELFKVMGAVKYRLLKDFSNFGLTSINEVGFEADDLARLFSLLAVERKEKICLVSRDSDWICMSNSYTDVLHYRNMTDEGHYLYNYLENPYRSEFKSIDPFHYYQIKCILEQNHNDIELPTEYKNFSVDQIGRKIEENDLVDIGEFIKYYKALYVDDLMDEIRPRLLRVMLNAGSWNVTDWLLYQESNGLSVYPYYYVKVMKCLDTNLYKG